MAIIFCFRSKEDEEDVHSTSGYSVKNTTSGFIWSCDNLLLPSSDSLIMVVVPKSIFSVTDDDNTIELTTNSDVKVVGIHLLYKTETETIADVLEKPAIDIDALKLIDPILHDIFLDIACFFVGWQKNNVVQLLGTYYTNVHHNIDILQNRCLLKINDQDRLEMDDLHQYQGRKIAWNGSDSISRKIDNQKYALEGESFAIDTFKRMSKLRFLYLSKVNLTGSFEQAFEGLRWFCWAFCPLKCLPSDFCPQELVTLELPRSNMTTFWEPNVVSNVFRKLKTLNMSYSRDLITTPDFRKLPSLKTLNFEGCESLEEIHESIEILVRLDSLNLKGCKKLRFLPDTICNLRALKVLNISDCNSLKALSLQLGNIKSLTVLNVDGLSVSKLPVMVRHIIKLFKKCFKKLKYCQISCERLQG
ncbi:hypothetical protein AgCh_039926 [Apium graveolens]